MGLNVQQVETVCGMCASYLYCISAETLSLQAYKCIPMSGAMRIMQFIIWYGGVLSYSI